MRRTCCGYMILKLLSSHCNLRWCIRGPRGATKVKATGPYSATWRLRPGAIVSRCSKLWCREWGRRWSGDVRNDDVRSGRGVGRVMSEWEMSGMRGSRNNDVISHVVQWSCCDIHACMHAWWADLRNKKLLTVFVISNIATFSLFPKYSRKHELVELTLKTKNFEDVKQPICIELLKSNQSPRHVRAAIWWQISELRLSNGSLLLFQGWGGGGFLGVEMHLYW